MISPIPTVTRQHVLAGRRARCAAEQRVEYGVGCAIAVAAVCGRQRQPERRVKCPQSREQAQAGGLAAIRHAAGIGSLAGHTMVTSHGGSVERGVVSDQGHGLLSSAVMARRRIRRLPAHYGGWNGPAFHTIVVMSVNNYRRPSRAGRENWPKDTGSSEGGSLPFLFNL